MTTRTWFLLYPALIAAAACGDDSSESNAIQSGLASDKPLASLTEREARRLCDATLDAIDELWPRELQVDGACSVAGSALAIVVSIDWRARIDQATCEQQRDACIAEANATPTVETRTCDLGSAERKPTCTATVGDFERCAGASLRAAAMYTQENWTCEALAAQPVTVLPDRSKMETPTVHVPECETFEATCGPFHPPML
ncbi:MAG TPA: hypothetical protein VJR89_22260 [Polyangiales bacterium]|nr:hypothetical protein [Polyangiales bacterium]